MELWVRWGKKPTPCQVGQTEWDPVTVLGVPNVAGCTDTELRKGSSRGLPVKKNLIETGWSRKA